MPGYDSCVQCGSVLKAASGQVDIDPPRMSKWKIPFRSLMRSVRGSGVPVLDMPDTKMPKWVKLFVGVGTFGVILSFIPGLGHALLRAFKTIRMYVLAWAILLPLALFFHGGTFGAIFLGLAFGVHVWIAMHCSLIREHEEFLKRIIAFVIIAFFYLVFYRSIWLVVFHDIIGAHSTMNAPCHRVETGDFLIARRSLAKEQPFERGALAIVRLTSIGVERSAFQELFMTPEARSFGQVIGLPGEEVEIKERCFYIDGQPLDTEKYPVPDWIGDRQLKTTVPDACYFMIAEYNGRDYGVTQIIGVCTVQSDRIEAKVFMRWLPLSRKGFIREAE
jgi:hypothetical protein